MAQWFAAKSAHPDALLFFRMGDFFEMFFDDAVAAVAALDIALTHRGEHEGQPIPMCGVPVASADLYLSRLIRRGFRIAIVEQMEDPKARARGVKGPIAREVVRLVTPGTLTEDTLLDASRPNFLLALVAGGAAWLDVSTGLFETQPIRPDEVLALLARVDPAEILAPASLQLGDWSSRRAPDCAVSPPLVARRRLAEAFGLANLDGLGEFSDAEAMAALAALDYVRATQAGALPRLSRPSPVGRSELMAMDAATRASLEIARARDGGTRHTLLASIRRTLTAAGARTLADWLAAPLTDPARIAARQDGWSWLLANPASLAAVRAAFGGAPDMRRALGRLSIGRGGPRDLASLRDGQSVCVRLVSALDGPLEELRRALSLDTALLEILTAALADPLPARLEEGGCIARGFDAELDAECGLRDDSRRVVAQLQLAYAQRFGVASLKIKHHQQLGYVIEVPALSVEKLRAFPDLILRQAMANGARFALPELSDLDRRITEAASRAAARERVVYSHLVQAALAQADALEAAAEALARLDVLQAAASLAEGGTWCRPAVTEGEDFLVEAGRHPVVQAALSGKSTYVPNDCDLSPQRRVLLLTGPNMAGKSTYLRQNALLVILAQAGLPVPAASARIGVVDRLFSRVGAADDLARGNSTFMVEMTETAAILHQAGPRSLVVVDEIGRGTATLDGLAIAWAVLEALHNQVRCRTIFATHFHELARLNGELPRLAPHTMRVQEFKGQVVFLHEVAQGAGGRSWGVHVAKLAGVPTATVRRAAALLAVLEQRGADLTADAQLPLFAGRTAPDQPAPEEESLVRALAEINPDALTPLEALATLYRLKLMLAG
jgi:DNA mismatch repair protein MutS